MDAQSALRRCIELFSHNTRFFIIVEDKYKLLKPILSRFSEIYIPLPVVNGKPVNLHTYNINNNATSKIQNSIKRYLVNFENNTNNIIKISELMYNKGISGLDLIEYISYTFKDDEYKYKLLAVISKSKLELHNELITILFILNLMFFRSNEHLENILSGEESVQLSSPSQVREEPGVSQCLRVPGLLQEQQRAEAEEEVPWPDNQD